MRHACVTRTALAAVTPGALLGVGSGQFRGGRTFPDAKSRATVSICTWLVPWLLPVGLLGPVALISPSPFEFVAAGIWAGLCFRVLPGTSTLRRGPTAVVTTGMGSLTARRTTGGPG